MEVKKWTIHVGSRYSYPTRRIKKGSHTRAAERKHKKVAAGKEERGEQGLSLIIK